MNRYRKRHLRVLPPDGGYYVHVMSRARGQAFLFQEEEKSVFIAMLRKWADFSGIGIVTYCVMGNHFHILLYVPPAEQPELGEVVRRLRSIWDEEKVDEWVLGYSVLRGEKEKEVYLQSVISRMNNLPKMMRALKQAFSRWYNVRHDTRGALWEDRYKSVVLEPGSGAVLAVSAYIDLNPVRAGLCDDPANYFWNGYGQAVRGVQEAREGLKHLVVDRIGGVLPYGARRALEKSLLQDGVNWKELGNIIESCRRGRMMVASWPDIQGIYRCWLYAKGGGTDRLLNAHGGKRKGWTQEEMDEVYATGGALPQAEILNTRCAYFTRGIAMGGAAYVSALFTQYREKFGMGRKNASLDLTGQWGNLKVLLRSGQS